MIENNKGKHKNRKRPVTAYLICIGFPSGAFTKDFVGNFESVAEAARETGNSPSSVANVLNGKKKQVNGYTYEYKN